MTFGTVGALKDGERLEITTYRKEVYAEEHRKPAVTFGDDILVDLSRRDFTINAMAVRLPDGEFVDPYGGRQGARGAACSTRRSIPRSSFSDDPLADDPRRAVRRAARGATGRPRGRGDARDARTGSTIVSAERIRDELDKLLVAEHAPAGLELLVDTGLADRFLPELPALSLEQDPVHRHKDVLRHTYAVVDRCEPDARAAAGGAAARRRQARDAEDHARGRDVPPSRGRGRADRRGCG